jgi:glycosyltransferase involved in cell wall biosynthesis
MKIPVSVVILTLNEVERIERALSSVRHFSQIIVVDSLSQDGTLEKARELWNLWGERPESLTLVSRSWRGYTQTRNESLNWVREKWTLWLDADEWLSDEFLQWCAEQNWQEQIHVFELARQSYFLGHAIRHGGWYPDFKKRLAPSEKAIWQAGPLSSDVHEDLYLKGEETSFRRAVGHIYHEPFRDEEEQKKTNEHYSSLLAEGLAGKWMTQKRSLPTTFYICLKGFIKFIENYVWKLGFLDGVAGFKIAKGSAWSIQQRLLKARAICQKKRFLGVSNS